MVFKVNRDPAINSLPHYDPLPRCMWGEFCFQYSTFKVLSTHEGNPTRCSSGMRSCCRLPEITDYETFVPSFQFARFLVCLAWVRSVLFRSITCCEVKAQTSVKVPGRIWPSTNTTRGKAVRSSSQQRVAVNSAGKKNTERYQWNWKPYTINNCLKTYHNVRCCLYAR